MVKKNSGLKSRFYLVSYGRYHNYVLQRTDLSLLSTLCTVVHSVYAFVVGTFLIPKYIWYGSIVPTLEISMYMYNVHT